MSNPNPLARLIELIGKKQAERRRIPVVPAEGESGQAIPAEISAMFNSPFVRDTVAPILGLDARSRPIVSYSSRTLRNGFDPVVLQMTSRDTIQANPNVLRFSEPELHIAHEMSHIFDDRSLIITSKTGRADFASSRRRRELDALHKKLDERYNSMPDFKVIGWQMPRGRDWRVDNRREMFAYAFENSLRLIRRYGAVNDPEGFSLDLSDTDISFPGTKEITEFILNHPVYREHPLHGFFDSKSSGTLPGVTVRRPRRR